MLQDFTVEHEDPELIAYVLRHAVNWGSLVEGYFICTTPPVIAYDEFPSHTLACYREHHRQPIVDPAHPISEHIAAIGKCNCLGRSEAHPHYATTQELSDAVLTLLRIADPNDFRRQVGHDGPFHGTDATIKVGYRLHYCSWHWKGLWLSFRHIYVGK